MIRHFLLLTCALGIYTQLFAQGERKDKTAVTYEELYDEPYSVNKLFIGFQPLYGELFVTNVNAGFGAEAVFYHQDKMDFRAHFRKTYSSQFFDLGRNLAEKKSDVLNEPNVFTFYELGATYHLKDFEESSKTKLFLYKKSYKGNKWSARVPLNAEVPCKVRKVYGLRLGGIFWKGSTDLDRALEKQGLVNEDLRNIENDEEGLPSTMVVSGDVEPVNVFGNINSASVYLGGSLSWIKNVAVNFDKFEEGVDDLMFTVFLDVIYSPLITIDNIVYRDIDPNTGEARQRTFSTDAIKTSPLGFRAGVDGRFNRQLSWAYGGEVGYRPSMQGLGFYALLKISFPVFGTNLDYKVESFGK